MSRSHSIISSINASMGRSRRRGSAAVEMAFVAPVLFTLLLGSIEFGRAMMVANLLTSASREGARLAAVPNGSNSDATTAINSELSAGGISTSKATTTIKVNGTVADASTAKTGDQISVSISVPYKDVTWLPAAYFLGNTTNLVAQVVMRRE